MEHLFLTILVLIMIVALASGFPVAFALPGSAIISIGLAAFLDICLRETQCVFCNRWTNRMVNCWNNKL